MTLDSNSFNLSETDRKLLNIAQTRFPLNTRPYASIGDHFALSEKEIITRISELKENRIIRRIGGIFDAQKLRFKTTLVALKVNEESIDTVANKINRHPGVTHNYQRQHEFNLWFTLITASEEEMQNTLNSIKTLPGVIKLRNLPALKQFKINVNFDMTKE